MRAPLASDCRELRLRRQDETWRRFEVTLTNLLDDQDVGGVVINARDVSEYKAAEAGTEERAESFSTPFHGTAEAIIIHDGETFVAVNRAYADLVGLEPEAIVGRNPLEFVAPNDHALALDMMRLGEEIPCELVSCRADGSTFPVEFVGRRIRCEGRWLRLLTVRDITNRRRVEVALRASEARQSLPLRVMQTQREIDDPAALMLSATEAPGRFLKANRVGLVETNPDRTVTFAACWTDGTLEPLTGTFAGADFNVGWRDEALPGRIFSVLDWNDPLTADSTFDALGAHAGIGAPIICGGRWRAGLYVNQATLRDWTADEIALVREIADLTWDAVERVRAEAALKESEARFRALVQEASDIVIVFESGGGLRYANPAVERILGRPVESYAAGLRLDIVHPDDLDTVVRTWTAVTEMAGAQFRITYRCRNADGAWVWLEGIATNLIDLPAVGGVVLNARDASEQKRLEAELRRLALQDPLTGLPNRTLLADRMDYALLQAAHHGDQVAILFLDLDYFKHVNHAFGHAAGDELLRSVTVRLTSALRVSETVARVGGDEFVVLLPRIVHERDAMEVAGRLLAVMTAPFVWRGREVTVGVTIGIALAENGLVRADVLLRDGDAALYGLESRPGVLAILKGIISLAHTIGLIVTAEGIETAGQLTQLRAIGCDRGQGFYLARPKPADAQPPALTITQLADRTAE